MRAALAKIASRIRRRGAPAAGPGPDEAGITAAEREILERAQPYSMTSAERLLAVVDAVRYVVGRQIPGAFAECGVWRGGSVLAMVLALQQLDRADRDIHLYDTFAGMTEPSAVDVSADESALETWRAAQAAGERPWPDLFGDEVFSAEQVLELLGATGYPAERIHAVAGPVEQTLPRSAPERLALVRLDTDWYESTRHELEHLYPRLAPGGVLIVDDYGHWQGARRAVDEYFDAHPPRPLLARIDYTGRIAVKA